MKFQHDSYENEQNAGRAHFAMKWGYRAHNVLLIAIMLYVAACPIAKLLIALVLLLCSLGIWINGEAAQWHARATDDHYARAEKLQPANEPGFPDVEDHAAARLPRRLNLDPEKARGAHA
jgi:hypothetical protein